MKNTSAFILLFLLLLLVDEHINNSKTERNQQQATIEQQREIVNKIGINGYNNAAKVGCLSDIISKMNGNEWNDAYCASSYNHLEF